MAAHAGQLTLTFVPYGIESANEEVKAAASDKAVTVNGASTARQAIQARLADELHIDSRPALLGGSTHL